MEQLLAADEAAAYLRVSQATLRRWRQEGRVRGGKIGHEWWISASALRRQMTAGEQPNAAGTRPGDQSRPSYQKEGEWEKFFY